MYCDKSASFEVVHGLLDRLMLSLAIPRISGKEAKEEKGYWIEEDVGNETFFPGRAAKVHLRLPKEVFNPGAATDAVPPR